MILRSINGIPIIDDDGKVIGILTIIDILRAIRDNKNIDGLKAGDIMTKSHCNKSKNRYDGYDRHHG